MASSPRVLRAVALVAVAAGAVGSLGFMFFVGRHNRSLFLMVLFTVWVLAPFVALAAADRMSTRWSASIRATLHGLMLMLTVVSLGIYGNVALGPPRPQPAAMFLMVPAASLLLIAILVAIVLSRSGKPTR